MEIQQVALDGEGVRPEGWPVSHVGHRLETFAADAQPRDVHPDGGNQFVVARQVHRRHCVFVPIASSATWIRKDAEGAAEQRARLRHFSFGDQFANLGTGDVMTPQYLLGIDDGGETKLFAQIGQRVHVALRFVAEVEVVTLVYLARMESVDQYGLSEVVRRSEEHTSELQSPMYL